jgi:hypothetical protein
MPTDKGRIRRPKAASKKSGRASKTQKARIQTIIKSLRAATTVSSKLRKDSYVSPERRRVPFTV